MQQVTNFNILTSLSDVLKFINMAASKLLQEMKRYAILIVQSHQQKQLRNG